MNTFRTYTPQDVAEALQLTPRCVYDYLHAGKIPGRKIGGRWRVLESELHQFVTSGQASAGDAE